MDMSKNGWWSKPMETLDSIAYRQGSWARFQNVFIFCFVLATKVRPAVCSVLTRPVRAYGFWPLVGRRSTDLRPSFVA